MAETGRNWQRSAGVVSVRVEAGASNRGNRGYGTLLTISGTSRSRIITDQWDQYQRLFEWVAWQLTGRQFRCGRDSGVFCPDRQLFAEYGRASGGSSTVSPSQGTISSMGMLTTSCAIRSSMHETTSTPPQYRIPSRPVRVSGGVPIIKNKTSSSATSKPSVKGRATHLAIPCLPGLRAGSRQVGRRLPSCGCERSAAPA